MKDQEIIDNAPEGATHWDCHEYMRHIHDGNWDYWSKAAGWNETKPEEETRSLADIKRIVELEKAASTQKGLWVTSDDLQALRLEQQAKALNEYAYSNKPLTKRDLNLESIALIDQAIALKEGKR
jgi:hypothetical protein